MNRKRNRSPRSKYGRTADPHEWYSPSCIWPLGDSLEPSTLFWPWRFFSGKFAYIEVRNVTRSILLTHSKPGGVHFLIGWMTAKVKSPLQWEVLLQRRAEALKLGLPSRRPPLYLSGLSGASVFSSLGFPFLPHTCCGRWHRPQPGEESRPHPTDSQRASGRLRERLTCFAGTLIAWGSGPKPQPMEKCSFTSFRLLFVWDRI